nr:quinone-dependent dihydroorotate dehydrogenase [Neptunicella marina]
MLQKLLFQLDGETSHNLTMAGLKLTQHNALRQLYSQVLPKKPVSVFGLEFDNPVGLAAGLDKNGECIDAFAAMGFGFIEVGTVTPVAQDGNDKPRLFRLKDANAIINRMGFNNKGVDYLVEQVKQAEYSGVLGINIGKNKVTEEKDALSDYLICLNKVYEHASYVTVNISSPNTPGLRNLQYGEALDNLLNGLMLEQQKLADQHGRKVPILIKIAPDLTTDEINDVAVSLTKASVDGVIATNTTLSREGVEGLRYAKEAGGLSGQPLTDKSLLVTEQLVKALDGAMPVVGVGGIYNGASAKQRLNAGASLIQVYSALIYQGPDLIKQIVQEL